MALPSEVFDVKNWLKQQHITVSTDWLEACVEFVKQEHTERNLSSSNLKKYVYEQWLAADLEEIQMAVLSPELSTSQKVTLNGCFALQVDGIRDVGQPAYSQLKHIEGASMEDNSITEHQQEAVPKWESKPTRMLMLNLTDGCTRIQGMEYKPIQFLSPNLPPGVKVLICGPVNCRLGVLLLTSEKIKVLGGEVEGKLARFSREAILRDILQIPSNEDDAPLQICDTNPSGAISTTSTSRNFESASVALRNNHSTLSFDSGVCSTSGDHVSQTNRVQNNASIHRNSINAMDNDTTDLDHFESDNDDFVQGLDYTIIDELEKKNSKDIDIDDMPDVWLDDDALEMMPIPDEIHEYKTSQIPNRKPEFITPYTYLSAVLKNPSPNGLVTVKGFIITVLSKLECTPDVGWNLTVKLNDGTATLDVNIHDKVLENFIGISASRMVDMQIQAAQNPELKKKIMEAISSCKTTLQNLNCLMDIQFCPGIRPCVIKCNSMDKLHTQELLERVHCYM